VTTTIDRSPTREGRAVSDTPTEIDPPDDDATPDVAALRAERDALAQEVEVLHDRKRRKSRARGVVAVVGVVMSCVLLVTACLGVWARRSFLKTDNFSTRAGELIDDPGVQTALSAYLTDQLNQLIDPQTIFADALPDEAQILAVPLAGAVEGFVGDQVSAFIASDTFAQLWKDAVEVAHREVVRVLEGDTPLLEESNDQIVINLLPVINQVLAQIGEASPEVLGRSVDLPTITVDDVPDVAREAIGDALGITLDDDFGTFTIYDDGALSSAQEAVSVADRLVWVLVVLAPLAIAATIAVSNRRRRTLLQLTVGVALSMVLVRRLVFLFQKDLLDYVRIERNVPAVEATSDAFLDPLLNGALWIGIGALVIATIAALTGPYPWAIRLRSGAAALVRTVVSAAGDRTQDQATIDWVGANIERLRIGGLVVGLVLLWWLDLSWFGFFLLAAVIGGYELLVHRLAEQATPAPEETADALT
jgi:hypothetical protein